MQPGNIQRANVTLEAMQAVAKEESDELRNESATSRLSFAKDCEDNVNPFARLFTTARKKIDARGPSIKKAQEAKEKSPQLLSKKEIEDKADTFQQRNPELKKETLEILRSNIKPDAKAGDILATVTSYYSDIRLADDALQFLFETTTGELQNEVAEAIKQFRELKGPEIAASKNVAQKAMEATEKELGTYTDLKDLYKDITQVQRDTITLFGQFSNKYDHKELKAIMDYLLHNLGSNMKNPQMERAELQRLVSATRSLQAITGVYRFFKSRMPLVEKMFKEEGLPIPAKLSFESLSKAFMSLVVERYPSGDKVKQQAIPLGIEENIPGRIIAFTQCRDGVREVSLNQIYRSVLHRDELAAAIIDALSDLEDDLEASLDSEQADIRGG